MKATLTLASTVPGSRADWPERRNYRWDCPECGAHNTACDNENVPVREVACLTCYQLFDANVALCAGKAVA